MEKFRYAQRLQGTNLSVWNEYFELERKYKPLNLGHGFPNEPPPSFVTDALIAAVKNDNPLSQQYARGFGHPRLVQAISKLFSGLINRKIDPENEILVTIGAYEALFSAVMSSVDKDDEVILIEPFYDSYEPMVKMAGGVPRFIQLRPKYTSTNYLTSGDFGLVDEELESVFNEKTKMIIINTPHNPLGKVFTREELEKIAKLCRKWDVLCVSDEVYEWLVYEGNEHIRMCTLPGMWERTITVGSAGKTFSVTGWKTGWTYGPANLIANLRLVHQSCVYTCPTPLQEAVAICFEHETKRLNTSDSYFQILTTDLKIKRDFMIKCLRAAGMCPITPEGGCFILADWSPLAHKIDLSSEADIHADCRFTKWMIKNIGLQAIPPSVFYSEANKHMAENYVRYNFLKSRKTLKSAAELLKNFQGR